MCYPVGHFVIEIVPVQGMEVPFRHNLCQKCFSSQSAEVINRTKSSALISFREGNLLYLSPGTSGRTSKGQPINGENLRLLSPLENIPDQHSNGKDSEYVFNIGKEAWTFTRHEEGVRKTVFTVTGPGYNLPFSSDHQAFFDLLNLARRVHNTQGCRRLLSSDSMRNLAHLPDSLSTQNITDELNSFLQQEERLSITVPFAALLEGFKLDSRGAPLEEDVSEDRRSLVRFMDGNGFPEATASFPLLEGCFKEVVLENELSVPIEITFPKSTVYLPPQSGTLCDCTNDTGGFHLLSASFSGPMESESQAAQ